MELEELDRVRIIRKELQAEALHRDQAFLHTLMF